MNARKYKEIFWQGIFYISGIFLPGILIAILGLLIFFGASELSWEFLTTMPKGMYLGAQGGIYPAIIGTFALVTIAVFAASLPALATAVYLTEYSNSSQLGLIIDFIIRSMVGIPSILTGLFGYSFFVLYLGFGISLISGGLTLAVMIFPTLVVLMQDALWSVNNDYRLAGVILGVSRRYILCRIILPLATPFLLEAVLLAVGYAAGATAPIMITAAVITATIPSSVFEPVMALPYHLYILFSQHISLPRAYTTALVLVGLLLIVNTMSILLRVFLTRARGLIP